MGIKNKFLKGIILGVIGVVLFSSKAIMIKLAYQFEIDAVSMLFFRMAFSFPFYLIIALFWKSNKTQIPMVRKDIIWIIFFGFIGYYLASLFDFIGLKYIKASLERVILFIYPTLVLLLNKIFLKKPITKMQAIAIGLTYLGVVITFSGDILNSNNNTFVGGFFVLLSAITYATYLVGSGWLIPKFGIIKFTSYVMLVSCVCVFIHYPLVSNTSLFNYPLEVYMLGGFVAVFATVIPSFLVSASIKMISSSNFAVVAGIGPISTIILAVIFLDEHLSTLQLFGTLIVIFGIFLVSRSKEK